MIEDYQLYPRTVKALASEMISAVDDYFGKRVDSSQLQSLLLHWANAAEDTMFAGPGQFSPTLVQRLGARRLNVINSLLHRTFLQAGNPFISRSLIITVGFPGSGKSTLVKRCTYLAPRIVGVCPDSIRLAIHGVRYKKSEESLVWSTAQLMAKALLREGYIVIIDATNTTKKERSSWRKVAGEFNLDLSIFHVDTPPEICRNRNQKLNRSSDELQAFEQMVRRFQTPSVEEGYIYKTKDIEKWL